MIEITYHDIMDFFCLGFNDQGRYLNQLCLMCAACSFLCQFEGKGRVTRVLRIEIPLYYIQNWILECFVVKNVAFVPKFKGAKGMDPTILVSNNNTFCCYWSLI